MKGKVVSWKADKGFGFIVPEGKTEQIFFHNSNVKKAARKPEVGDLVLFEVIKDAQGRLKAMQVVLENVPLEHSETSKRIRTEPVKKDALDYFIYLVLLVLLAISLTLFLKTGVLESALVPSAAFLILLLFITGRKKQPKNKLFSCAKCRAVTNHDKRTVLAWNKGANKLYCPSCHQAWLREHSTSPSYYASSKSGCLGVFLVMVFIPVACIAGAITWIV